MWGVNDDLKLIGMGEQAQSILKKNESLIRSEADQ
jgi:hypothetical protein